MTMTVLCCVVMVRIKCAKTARNIVVVPVDNCLTMVRQEKWQTPIDCLSSPCSAQHLTNITVNTEQLQLHLLTSVTTSASKKSIRRFVITEKAPTRAFSWLKAALLRLLRHYAKRAMTPRSLKVKLGPRRNYLEGQAAMAIRHYANQPVRPS